MTVVIANLRNIIYLFKIFVQIGTNTDVLNVCLVYLQKHVIVMIHFVR